MSGEIHLGWSDGDWLIKLPSAAVETIKIRDGKTSSLSLFIWNSLTPGAEITLHPPRGASPGAMVVDRARPIEATPKARSLPSQEPGPEEAKDVLLIAVRRAVERIGTPVCFEHIWAMLNDRGIDLQAAEVIALLRQLFHVDDLGTIRAHDDAELATSSFRRDDCQWDNIEQANWELNAWGEPPYLERMYRKRKSSIHDGMEYHLDETRHGLLTAEQEARLGAAIHAGQKAEVELHEGETDFERKIELGLAVRAADEARERFLEHNLRLVFNIAVKYERKIRRTALGVADLVQAGYEGLIRAVEKFDPEKGYKFSTYATWWIKQAVSRHIAEGGRTIRIPVYLHDSVATFRRVQHRILTTSGLAPTSAELAEKTGLAEDTIKRILDLQEVTSLEGHDESSDVIVENEVLRKTISKETQRAVDAVLSGVDSRLAKIITYRFGLDSNPPRTLEEIGQIFSVTRERVRQLEKKALKTLRASPELQRAVSEEVPASRADDEGHERPPTDQQIAAWEQVRERARIIETINRE